MARIAAWMVLRSGSHTPLREVEFAARERELDDRDRGLLRRIVGTEVRHRGTLRAWAKRYVHGRAKPDLLAHVHIALAQLLYFDRIPSHAIFASLGDAVHRTLGPSKVRPAQLALHAARGSMREGYSGNPRQDLIGRELHCFNQVFRDPVEHPLLWAEDALSIPANLMKRWTKRYGRERAETIARTFSVEPPLAVHGVGISAEETARLLTSLGLEAKPTTTPGAFLLPSEETEGLTRAQAFEEGRLVIQGEHAFAAAQLVRAEAGERILDLCAAPGGKTTVLASAGAHVTAVDSSARRIETLQENLQRLQLAGSVNVCQSDGTADLEAGDFDAVLVDPPCSNTGVLGARPGARWRFGPASLRSLTELQERLLAEAAARVRPGGRLVWSTCSLEPEENGQRVRRFLEANSGWELEEELESVPSPEGPFDGGYAARLRRGD